MSSYVDREWFYYLRGRELLLYKMLGGSSSERITQSGVLRTRGKELMYPNEDIADGLRVEYTALNEPFVEEAFEDVTAVASGTGIAIVDGGGGSDTMTDTEGGLSVFQDGDRIRIQGSSSLDGDYNLSGSVSAGTLTFGSGTFASSESAGERITVTQIPKEDKTPDATNHINLNRMLSLAVVDYLKAMTFESAGDIERKEYYMKEFFGKLGDNESNKRNISVSFPSGPFAVR
jgi:hypothetical protein